MRRERRPAMAIAAQVLALFLIEHAREPFVGPVLSYGKQNMNVDYNGALWLLAAVGIEPDPAGMVDPPPPGTYIEFERLVKLLGLGQLHMLDLSAYEGADVVADLNAPVPQEFAGRFGWIIDGGTIEHVFDIRQGMMNTADMLRPGGRVVHLTPVNNQVNHGFVQVSPTLYHDYYVENGFDDVRGIMVVTPRDDSLIKRWNFFTYDHAAMSGLNSMLCAENTMLGVYFTARKTPASTSGRIPTQSYFSRLHDGRDTQPSQLVITHDPAHLNIRQITEAHSPAQVTLQSLVADMSIATLDLRSGTTGGP